MHTHTLYIYIYISISISNHPESSIKNHPTISVSVVPVSAGWAAWSRGSQRRWVSPWTWPSDGPGRWWRACHLAALARWKPWRNHGDHGKNVVKTWGTLLKPYGTYGTYHNFCYNIYIYIYILLYNYTIIMGETRIWIFNDCLGGETPELGCLQAILVPKVSKPGNQTTADCQE